MKKRYVRIGAGVLAVALAAGMLPIPRAMRSESVKAAEYENAAENEAVERSVEDLLQLKTEDGKSTQMQLYANGVYESKIDLSEGNHTLSLYRNGEETLTDEVSLSEAGAVYVRYKDGELMNSIENADQYHTAALTGNFWGLEFVDEEGNDYSIASWDPADVNAELDYVGGGIYKETFQFKETTEDVVIQDGGYKISFDDGWDYSIGNGSGNIELTVPAGTDSMTVFVDEITGQVYDSIRTEPLQIYQNSGAVTSPAFGTTVSLIGSVRQDESVNWDAAQTGYEFTQITEKLYLYQETFAEGNYEYKAVFNYANWYESFGGGNKTIMISEDDTNVIFLYDVETDKLYDTRNDYNIVAEKLGFAAAPVASEVIDHVNGTTTFVIAAEEGDTVELYCADKANADQMMNVSLTKGTDSNGNFNGSYVTEELFFGDQEAEYIYYYLINGERALDPSRPEIEVNGEAYSYYKRNAFEGRLVCVPGTFPGPSWDAASNVMTYEGNGLYSYTFKNVPAANYEFKVAMGEWTENYGAGGKLDGSNYALTVPEPTDVTVYYSDLSHLAVTDLDYIFADITLEGSDFPQGMKLDDRELTGIYSISVELTEGTYDDLSHTYNGKEFKIKEFELTETKVVTFYFDPVTEIYYNDASDEVLDEESIYFDSKDEDYKSVYGAVPTNTDVTFSIDTGVDAEQVTLVVKGREKQILPLEKNAGNKKEDDKENGTVRWSVTTQFKEYGSYQYYFVVGGTSSVKIYCDDDGYYGIGMTAELTQVVPYEMNVYKEGFETPDWMKDAVIYQIFPDRFFNGDKSNDAAQTDSRGAVDYEFVEDWYILPENPEQQTLNPDKYPANAWNGDGEWSNEIYGGDLKGITEKIDYLKALGVNVIYLNPVFHSISSHRYDATDYAKIDPILGTMGDFTEMVETAEANGMHVVLDGVFNHVSDDSVYFDRYYKFVGKDGKVGAYPYWAYVYDYLAANEGAEADEAEAEARKYFEAKGVSDFTYTEWFAISQEAMTDENGEPVQDSIGDRAGMNVYRYDGWWGYDSMPVIMSVNGSEYQAPGWADEIIDGENSVARYWLKEGSDGWRLDVANEVSDETWQRFRESVKSLSKDNVIIGEIWDDASEYLFGDMYDSVMNYVFRDAVLAYAKGGSAQNSVNDLEKLRERYPKEAFYAMMNLVGSHDTTRLLSALDGIEDDRKQTDIESAFPSYETTSDLAKARQKLVAMIQMTYPGAPTIYYGDELGMVGADDPDDRRAMEWGKGNRETVETYAQLAAVRGAYPALRTGEIIPVETENTENIMAYIRSNADEKLYVAVNNDIENKQTVAFVAEAEKTYTDLLSGKEYRADKDGVLEAEVPALYGVILTDEVKDVEFDSEMLAPAYDPEYIYDGTAEGGTEEPGNPEEPKDPEDPKDPSGQIDPNFTEGEEETGSEGKTDAVNTGDVSTIYALGFVVSGSALCMIAVWRRKKVQENP